MLFRSFPAQVASALARCISDDGYIKDSASPELSLVRNEIRNIHRQCTTKVKDFAAEYNIMHYLQDDFMTLASDRYVLPLKTNFKGRLQGIIHDYSQTGETCYFEPIFLVEINNQLQNLKRVQSRASNRVSRGGARVTLELAAESWKPRQLYMESQNRQAQCG